MAAKTVLIALPDQDFDVTEVSVPWRLLTEAGHTVVFATEHGAVAAADPLLLTGVLFGKLGADPEPKAFYELMITSDAYQRPLVWADLDMSAYDGLLLPGGHAPGMRQYLASEVLQAKVSAFWALERPVGAICHGTIVVARAKDAEGRSLLHDQRSTCLPGFMERLAYWLTFWKLGRYYRTYPEYVEAEVKRHLGDKSRFERGPLTLGTRGTATDDSAAFVVESGRYLSARWPGDAYLFGRRFISLLEGTP